MTEQQAAEQHAAPSALAGALPPRSPRAAAISAHRGGGESAPEATYEAYEAAAQAGVEYVEFDIRRTADGELVVYHDARIAGELISSVGYARLCHLAGYEVPLTGEVMRLLAGRAIGHLDVKTVGDEEDIVRQAIDVLGQGNFVLTTLEDSSVQAITSRFPQTAVALSLGRDMRGLPWMTKVSQRRSELYPLNRLRACGAGWAAMHYQLGLAGALRQCHSGGIRTMVWTVNNDLMLRRLLADPRVDVVVTDRPRRAAALRAALTSS
ncbi:MAG TPA: glycerophosphodiester phosphodiesterase family protein [Streptosporangiaceae bacterium]